MCGTRQSDSRLNLVELASVHDYPLDGGLDLFGLDDVNDLSIPG